MSAAAAPNNPCSGQNRRRVLTNYRTAKRSNKVVRHSGQAHNQAIDQRAADLRGDPQVDNIRKNQQQVDVNGNNVGRNQPDLQYDRCGTHHCVEYDMSPGRSKRHGEVIRANDPNAKIELNKL